MKYLGVQYFIRSTNMHNDGGNIRSGKYIHLLYLRFFHAYLLLGVEGTSIWSKKVLMSQVNQNTD